MSIAGTKQKRSPHKPHWCQPVFDFATKSRNLSSGDGHYAISAKISISGVRSGDVVIKSLFIVLTIAFAPVLATVKGEPLLCQSSTRKALIEGNFSGPLICSRTDVSFVFIGRTSENDFTIYDYR